VRFLGFRDDVPDLLAAADFFVLSSLAEGLPLSILEAMAQRLPVVASNVGGIPEVVTHGEHGLLVSPQDPEALAEAIAQVAGNPECRTAWGHAAALSVRQHFTFDQVAVRYEDIYSEVRRRSAR
jgi:glycosyltransferase involved in cell wall biosynthesis